MTPTPSPRGSEELTVRTNPNSPPRTPRSALDAIEGGAPPSSARAVLEALRALQRKIVRLETERSSALREATELRHRFEGQSAASERASELQSRQLEDLERSFQLRESRLVRDRDDLTRRLDDAERDKLDALRECAGLRDRADALRARLARAEARAVGDLDAAAARSPGAGRDDALAARLASTTERAVAAELRVEDLENELRAARDAAREPPSLPPPPPPPPSPPPPPRLRLAAKPKRAAAKAPKKVVSKAPAPAPTRPGAGPAAAAARLKARKAVPPKKRSATVVAAGASKRISAKEAAAGRAASLAAPKRSATASRAATAAAPKRSATAAAAGRAAAAARLKATAKKIGAPKPAATHPYLRTTRPRRPAAPAPARAPSAYGAARLAREPGRRARRDAARRRAPGGRQRRGRPDHVKARARYSRACKAAKKTRQHSVAAVFVDQTGLISAAPRPAATRRVASVGGKEENEEDSDAVTSRASRSPAGPSAS